jgi:hypothetical protein
MRYAFLFFLVVAPARAEPPTAASIADYTTGLQARLAAKDCSSDRAEAELTATAVCGVSQTPASPDSAWRQCAAKVEAANRVIKSWNDFRTSCAAGKRIQDATEDASEDEPDAGPVYRISRSVSLGIHNMRKGPGQRHKLVVSIPAGSGGVVGTGRCSAPDDGMSRHTWCEVTWKGYRGWVSKGGLIRVR